MPQTDSDTTLEEKIEKCFDLRISSSGADIGIKFGDEPEFARVWVKYENFLGVRHSLEALIGQERQKADTAARIDELKSWVDVDTVPGIPIDQQTELERMIDGMRDRITALTNRSERSDR